MAVPFLHGGGGTVRVGIRRRGPRATVRGITGFLILLTGCIVVLGSLAAYLLTSAAITQGKQMEETIRRSGAFLQTVIDAIPDILLVIDTDCRIVLANHAAREMAGGIDPTVCLTCHQLSHHRDLPCAGKDEPCTLRQVIATKALVEVTHTHYDAGGKESFVEVIAAPVLDEAGEVSYIIEACRDVTDRMRLERAFRLTQFSVDHAGDVVFWLGSDARFFYANACACQHLGYSRRAAVDDRTRCEPGLSRRGLAEALGGTQATRFLHLRIPPSHQGRWNRPVEITVNYVEFEGESTTVPSFVTSPGASVWKSDLHA